MSNTDINRDTIPLHTGRAILNINQVRNRLLRPNCRSDYDTIEEYDEHIRALNESNLGYLDDSLEELNALRDIASQNYRDTFSE
jgi:hypothetical protein